MKYTLHILLTLLVILTGVQISNNNKVHAAPNAKIGFVNIPVIFKKYKKAQEGNEKMRQSQQKETLEIKKLQEEADELKQKIPLYRVGSKIRKRLESQLAKIAFEVKNKSESAKYFLALKMRNSAEEIYHNISKAIERYAKRHNYLVILKIEEADFFGAPGPNEVKQKIDMRSVLYWNKALDLTEEIIKSLNEQ